MADNIIALAEGFRAQLIHGDAKAIQSMTRRWTAVEASLQAAIDDLAQDMATLKANGEDVPQWKLWQMDKYQSLIAQIGAELAKYAQWAIAQIKDEQTKAQQLGDKHAKQMLLASLNGQRSLGTAWDKLPAGAAENIAAIAQGGYPLNKLLANAYPTAVSGLTNLLITNTALGKNPRETARTAVKKGLAQGLQHILLVARDQQIRNYREMVRQRYDRSNVVYGYMRLAARNTRTCLACLALDGTIYDTGEVMALHPQDRCAMVPLVEGFPLPNIQPASKWFESLSEDEQRRMMGGNKYEAWRDGLFNFRQLATVGNHPVWGSSAQVTSLTDLLKGGGNTTPNMDPSSLLTAHKSKTKPKKPKTLSLDSGDSDVIDKLSTDLDTAVGLDQFTTESIKTALGNIAGGDEGLVYTDKNGRVEGAFSYKIGKGNLNYLHVTGAGFASVDINKKAILDAADIAQQHKQGIQLYVPQSYQKQYKDWGFVIHQAQEGGARMLLDAADIAGFIKDPDNYGQVKLEQLAAEAKKRLADPNASLTFRPGQEIPGLPFKAVKMEDKDFAAQTKLQYEPPLDVPAGKHAAAGMLLFTPDGKLVVVDPANQYGGYKTTFPKGTQEDGMTLQETAVKEVWEETGFKAKVLGWMNDYEKSTSKTRFYIGVVEDGAPWAAHYETEAVRIVPLNKVDELLNVGTDKTILADLQKVHEAAFTDGQFDPDKMSGWLDGLAEVMKLANTIKSAQQPPPPALGVKKANQYVEEMVQTGLYTADSILAATKQHFPKTIFTLENVKGKFKKYSINEPAEQQRPLKPRVSTERDEEPDNAVQPADTAVSSQPIQEMSKRELASLQTNLDATFGSAGPAAKGVQKVMSAVSLGHNALAYYDGQGNATGAVSFFQMDPTTIKVSGAAFADLEVNHEAMADVANEALSQGLSLITYVPKMLQSQYTDWGFFTAHQYDNGAYMQIPPGNIPSFVESAGKAPKQPPKPQEKEPAPGETIGTPMGISEAAAKKLTKDTLIQHMVEKTYMDAVWFKKYTKADLVQLMTLPADEAEKHIYAGTKPAPPPPAKTAVAKKQPLPENLPPYQPPDPPGFPADMDGLRTVKSLGGSTGAKLVQDPDTGKQYVLKKGNSAGHLREEAYADAAYQALGFHVPTFKVYETADGPVKLAEYKAEMKSLAEALAQATPSERKQLVKAVQKGFAADALLGNWDVLGADKDNILVDDNGRIWRIDNGGSFRYRAQGKKKEDAFISDYPVELWTMRDKSVGPENAQMFGSLDIYDIMEQVRDIIPQGEKLLAAMPEELRPMVNGRLQVMQDLLGTSDTFKEDKWQASYTDGFLEHGTYMRREGLIDALPQRMKQGNKGSATVYDENGRKFDVMRGTGSHVEDWAAYCKANGGDPGIISYWMSAQAGSSWSSASQALKYMVAQNRGGKFGEYYWHKGLDIAQSHYNDTIQKIGEEKYKKTWAMWHAWVYESLRHMEFDRKKGSVVELVRTEADPVMEDNGFKVGQNNLLMLRGAAESGSIYRAKRIVAGGEVTRQRVPLHRILGYYWGDRPGQRNGKGGFLGDEENEFVFIPEGISFDYVDSIYGSKGVEGYW